MAVVRGAHADILAAEQDKRRHDLSLPSVELDKNTLRSTELAMQDGPRLHDLEMPNTAWFTFIGLGRDDMV